MQGFAGGGFAIGYGKNRSMDVGIASEIPLRAPESRSKAPLLQNTNKESQTEHSNNTGQINTSERYSEAS